MTFQRTIREIKPTMAGMTGPRRRSEARNRGQLPSFSDGPTQTRGTSGSTLRCTPVTWGSAPTGAFCPWTLSTPLTKPDSRVWQGSVCRSCHELNFYSVGFSQSGISGKKCVFLQTHYQGFWQLFLTVSLKDAVSGQQALQEYKTETRELLGGTKENKILHEKDLPSWPINDSITKSKLKAIELVARLVSMPPGSGPRKHWYQPDHTLFLKQWVHHVQACFKATQRWPDSKVWFQFTFFLKIFSMGKISYLTNKNLLSEELIDHIWVEICSLQAVRSRAGLMSWAYLLCPKHCLPPWDQDFPRQTPGLLSLSHAGGDIRHVPVHPKQAVTLDSDQTDSQTVAQVKEQLRELRRGYRMARTIHEVRWRRNLAFAVPLQQDWPTAALHVHWKND